MAGRDDATEFFRGISQRVTGRAPPGMPRTGAGSVVSTSALVSQVQNTAAPPHRSSSMHRTGSNAPGQRRRPTQDASADEEQRRKQRLAQIKAQSQNMSPMDPNRYAPLLPAPELAVRGRKCLVLDVDETLVHSSFTSNTPHDVHLECKVNNQICNVYVAYRPHVMDFLDAVREMFEIVIFTASVSAYCNPLMDRLDANRKLGPLRLFREHCSMVNGSYVKDLSLLGRSLNQIAIVDNSPVAYLFQPRNAIPIKSWFEDPNDTELLKLLPMLQVLARAPEVYDVLDNHNASVPEPPS